MGNENSKGPKDDEIDIKRRKKEYYNQWKLSHR